MTRPRVLKGRANERSADGRMAKALLTQRTPENRDRAFLSVESLDEF